MTLILKIVFYFFHIADNRVIEEKSETTEVTISLRLPFCITIKSNKKKYWSENDVSIKKKVIFTSKTSRPQECKNTAAYYADKYACMTEHI